MNTRLNKMIEDGAIPLAGGGWMVEKLIKLMEDLVKYDKLDFSKLKE